MIKLAKNEVLQGESRGSLGGTYGGPKSYPPVIGGLPTKIYII